MHTSIAYTDIFYIQSLYKYIYIYIHTYLIMCTVGPRGTYEASVLPTEGSWQLLGRDQSVLEETMGVPQMHREGHVAGRRQHSSPAKRRPFSLTSCPHPSSQDRKVLARPTSAPYKRRWLPDLPPDGPGQAEGAGSSGRGDCSQQGKGRSQETWNAGFHLPLPLRQWEGIQAADLPGRAVVMGPDASVLSWHCEGHGPSLPCLAWLLAGGRACPSIQVGIAGDSPRPCVPLGRACCLQGCFAAVVSMLASSRPVFVQPSV